MANPSNDARKVLRRKLNYRRVLGSSLGCFVGIGALGYFSTLTYSVLIIPSFGASCLIALVTPDSAFAQPRNVIGGHFFASLIGLVCSLYLGTSWWSFAAAVALATAVMQLTQTVHPPAAADPIFFVMQAGPSWQVLLAVLLGTVILVLFFAGFHHLVTRRPYPRYWL